MDRPPPEASAAPFSVAVLPFTNLSNDPNEDYLADGISEDLTSDLSHLEGAVVVRANRPSRIAARQWTFATWVGNSASVMCWRAASARSRRCGSHRREFVATDNGGTYRADRFDQPLRALQDGQDNTVQRIGTALDIGSIRESGNRRKIRRLIRPPHDLVLRGRAAMQERISYSRNVIAAGYFEQALREGPRLCGSHGRCRDDAD